ncbi:hypothetical protein TTHERM_00284140 (macronuclear) [Tetrahymena thermophila SB210]|uniref:Uncharacterized protein n=1 Tax=Tetrahymena thermophila (strain SB210) TaxID=312017 RepID=I7MKB7_TETTS|nr:hypothetical protein TTHERM_00284140 [Tetrahymena thermophila SB210]EAR98024.4 hypothetical protein TTHERM_00284140 [Tetrahymena thermophila SB210]|eukprot:XP_001018269.4 hypothetical protein TTHERM_00284140 [Tetrahymena thermophila SB210]
MSAQQPNDQFPAKWLNDSNLEDNQKDIKDLHLMKEGFKIVDKQGIVYRDLQFEEEKKPLSEQTKEALTTGAKLVGSAAIQVADASKYGFMKLFGFLQKAGDKIIGNLSAFQETYLQYRQKQKELQEQENKSQIQENWEIIVSDDTPQEEIDQIKKQIEEDGGVLKITRVQKAVNLQKLGSNLRIIQLQNSSESFCRFIENQPSRIRQEQFGLLDSENIEMRGALQLDDSEFEQMKKYQEELVKDQYFDWSRILSPNQNLQDEQNQQQNNISDSSECYVYRIDNATISQQSQQVFDANQYNNFMKVLVPSINPQQVNQMPQEYQENYANQGYQNNQNQNYDNQNNYQQNIDQNNQYLQNYYYNQMNQAQYNNHNQMNQPQYNNYNQNQNQDEDKQLEEPMAN